ncbi:MAG: tRNA (N(6)-L-threonylcarbamoyladenosine(37)-C(2))-methylthiotransferase MtaB [Desulfobulbaceae bacterium]|nr:tRNA (N(6)-L-threonylcarbamoyladenosine(37)-C(2))-methylthiotransferase MtaB [Desulfobulbaceae bacterium]
MIKVAIATLGCKVNQFESAAFSTAFIRAGCELVPFSGQADIYVINTCSVTGRAGQQSRQLIRRAMKTNPEAKLVITGCYAQMDANHILDIVDAPLCIVGNGNKHLLVETALADSKTDLSMLMGNIGLKKEITSLGVRRFPGRTRAYLRIQDGCNNFCSYCIVPYTRGRSRSVPLQQVLQQTATFAEECYREIVITGINVGKYGLDLEENETIYSLITRLCRDFPSIRFRLSSIELTEVNDRLLAMLTELTNFMPHLHLPLQSGDDRILEKMNRRYTAADFDRAVREVHAALPHSAVGCDILCGFPGESDEAFDNTMRLVAGLPLTYFHVFPYSKRPGTLAASMKNEVAGPVKDERVSRLRRLSREKKEEFYRRHVGTLQRVLVERQNKKFRLLQGFTENYLSVQFPGSAKLAGSVVQVRIDHILDGELFGSIEHSPLEIMK